MTIKEKEKSNVNEENDEENEKKDNETKVEYRNASMICTTGRM